MVEKAVSSQTVGSEQRAMTTIPARLAKAAQVSHSLAHAQSRSRSLYRTCYRAVRMIDSFQVPEICALYPLDVPPALLRAKIRTMFERNRHITDVAILDIMLHKGYQEYQETVNAWKQTPHIMKWFAEEEAPGTLAAA
ncbi:ndufa6 NADH-ubiquinone oxidoreductase subunit [Malassezia nana]|uniref:Ndufa6 NADH-ubiquinone oxidoreductase subunit n=1 Tax=Malassezia nana TaxID=180528 RepID=A0AAF0EJ72_9BASI|nr:ndufa6 NADH-ubiquinone oxidoreductase subunit [Malassezia nana]